MKPDRKIIPMILVKHSDDEDRERAIDHQIRCLLGGYMATKMLPAKKRMEIRRQILATAQSIGKERRT